MFYDREMLSNAIIFGNEIGWDTIALHFLFAYIGLCCVCVINYSKRYYQFEQYLQLSLNLYAVFTKMQLDRFVYLNKNQKDIIETVRANLKLLQKKELNFNEKFQLYFQTRNQIFEILRKIHAIDPVFARLISSELKTHDKKIQLDLKNMGNVIKDINWIISWGPTKIFFKYYCKVETLEKFLWDKKHALASIKKDPFRSGYDIK
jgi:hypothetical protein